MKKLVLLGLLCVFASCKKEASEPEDEKTTDYNSEVLEDKLGELFSNTNSKGMGIALFNGDQILFERGYGVSSLKYNVPYTTKTVQNIASISKVVTGLTLLKAMEGKDVKLSDDINSYLPFKVKNPLFPDESITIQQLVTHTSSIYDGSFYGNSYYTLEADFADDPDIDQEEINQLTTKENSLSLTEYLKATLEETDSTSNKYGYINYEPGSTYSYSNNGAGLIALIVESITGQDFKTYSQEHIIKPLSLENSTWQDDISNQHSYLYSKNALRYPFYGLLTAADGAYRTSTHELAILGQELIKAHQQEGTLLNDKSYEMFFKKYLDESHFKTEKSSKAHKEDEFNKGVFITYERGGIGHSGGDPGVTTLLYFHPETHKGFALLFNSDFNTDEEEEAFLSIAELMNAEIAKKQIK